MARVALLRWLITWTNSRGPTRTAPRLIHTPCVIKLLSLWAALIRPREVLDIGLAHLATLIGDLPCCWRNLFNSPNLSQDRAGPSKLVIKQRSGSGASWRLLDLSLFGGEVGTVSDGYLHLLVGHRAICGLKHLK